MKNLLNITEFILINESRNILGLYFDGFDEVIDYALLKYPNKTRKFSSQPAHLHPIKVAKIVYDETKNKELTIASFLHDIIEDSDVNYKEIEQKFGRNVANIVQELTTNFRILNKKIINFDDKTKAKTAYLAKKTLRMSDDALIIKLADRLDNLLDYMDDKLRKSTVYTTYFIVTYLEKYRRLNSVHKTFVDRIKQAIQPYLNLINLTIEPMSA